MPYIKQEDREEAPVAPTTPGELNYVITLRVDEYLRGKGVSYTSLNEVIGVLECAKLELYRRIAAPYEDQKKHDNGDVYTVQG